MLNAIPPVCPPIRIGFGTSRWSVLADNRFPRMPPLKIPAAIVTVFEGSRASGSAANKRKHDPKNQTSER